MAGPPFYFPPDPDYPDTFTISAGGKAITCKRCGMTSHHPGDVAERYCGRCHIFHDDVYPPARQAWIDDKPAAP